MAKYMLIKNDKVENIIEYDGVSSYAPPQGCALYPYQEGAAIGMDVVDGVVQVPQGNPVEG